MYPKRTEFVASYLEIASACYILLDNRELQSHQVGQEKGMAITFTAQATFALSVIKQSRY